MVIPGVCKSSKAKFQTKQFYIPIMIGSKRDVAVAQLEYHVLIHSNPHTLFMKKEEEKPNFIIAIMKQLSLKAGLK